MSTKEKVKIGVLALQGAFQLHQYHIEALNAHYVPVVEKEDFENIDGLILPGGESGTMLKLIEVVNIKETLHKFLIAKPAWGICAGAILMAKEVRNPAQQSFGILDFEVERNAYGRQLESSQEMINNYLVSYIRAPKISRARESARILSRRSGSPTWIEFESSMVTTFHPETNLTTPSPWHHRFIEFCRRESVT